jgi:hypothetical protein
VTHARPISDHLAALVRERVRQRGIVVWLDLDGHYTGFVDRLAAERAAGRLDYEVHAFRGSFLDLMLALEHVSDGVDPTRALIHLPGFTEESVKRTPLFELYAAGVRFRKRLRTLLEEAAGGRARPDQIQAFLADREPSLDDADAWLAGVLAARAGPGLAAQLPVLSETALIDDLLAGGTVGEQTRDPDARAIVVEHLAVRLGLTPSWIARAVPSGLRTAADLAFAAASFALAVEYVDDLQRPPVDPVLDGLASLPAPVVKANHEVAEHLRERHPAFYRRTAGETEAWLGSEVHNAKAEDLGKIDTFRFEEDKVLDAALSALAEERWQPARAWARARTGKGSFWLRDDPMRQSAWQLLQAAADLGAALTEAGPRLNARSHADALVRYAGAEPRPGATAREPGLGEAVDRAHRHLEQRRAALLDPQLPSFEDLRARLDQLREAWRTWADDWARDYAALCRDQGFLPAPALQQRTLFDDVVRPLGNEAGATAYFLVDALRFEMAAELFEDLAGTPATTVHLRARLAELPTVTEVGMNVLAPVVRGGVLTPRVRDGQFKGFAAGEFTVDDPATRKRAISDAYGGATCPWLTLAEVLGRNATSLRQAVARARLVVVHSIEIDNAGEKGAGPSAFDKALRDVRGALRLLRDAGVKRFVVTADHGFLLLDATSRTSIAHGRKIDPKRRHVVSTVAADHRNEVRVPLADLNYAVDGDLHLMFPSSTAVFDTGNRAMSFAHGGNSLQERVIPVLTVSHRAAAGGDMLRYAVHAEARDGVSGLQCLTGRVEVVDQGGLGFGGTREVELALRVVDEPDARVELTQVRDGGRLQGAAILAEVGRPFEVFFKLTGPTDARVRVELHHPAGVADVAPVALAHRFTVIGEVRSDPAAPAPRASAPGQGGRDWLSELPPGARDVFGRLANHGTATEDEVIKILGSGRAARAFARDFDALRKLAPFEVRVENVGGVKRYVRGVGAL